MSAYELTEEYVRDFIMGKSVLVLGSAQCVASLDPAFMESFDIIVRCNNHKNFNECTRTDIYYSFLGGSIKKSMEDIIADGAKFVFCRNPNMDFSAHVGGKYIPGHSIDATAIYEHRFRIEWFKIPYYIQSYKNYRRNYCLINRLLTTGVSAIIDVLRYDPIRLYVAGFDFFTTLIHNVDEPCNMNTGHDFTGEFNLVKKLWIKGKIEISEEMKKLFSSGTWPEIKERNDNHGASAEG